MPGIVSCTLSALLHLICSRFKASPEERGGMPPFGRGLTEEEHVVGLEG